MSDFKVGDKIEIVFHAIGSYIGKRGRIMFIGTSLKQGTDMLENNINTPDPEPRLIIALDDSTILNNMKRDQLRKV